MVVWSVKDSEESVRWRDWRFVVTAFTIALAIAAASAAVLLAAGSG